jgi:protein-S-isoprenylcysteine O-methyltransferase Ste14
MLKCNKNRSTDTSLAMIIFFSLSLALELFYILMFIITIRLPDFRFWPPPSHKSWQFFVAWFVAGVVAVNFLFLGLLDFDSFILPHFWLRLPFAFFLFLLAMVLGIWVYAVFPFRATIGLGNKLITNGPYRYSRNPQYICDSLSIIGFMILTNSWMVWVVGILGVILNILAPFTEEPWLKARFGDAYMKYESRVPRFIRLGRRDNAV